jgi:squalene synthase HpnC
VSAPALSIPKTPAESVEQWSGKDRADENFPVGSVLIRRSLRPHVHAYYAFARNADDIADSPSLAPQDKIDRLNTMQAVLLGRRTEGSPSATRLRASLAATGVSPARATDLLTAFRQDAVKSRYATWLDLADYCRHSANPVGRYLLDLHHEPAATHPGSDALCTSLQVLNHLQDCADDLRSMNRCYLPHTMLAARDASIEDLRRDRLTPALRRVLDDLLDHCDALNVIAETLAPACTSRGMRLEAAVIVNLAKRLARRLRHQDPLAQRVKLTRPDIAAAMLAALRHL